MKTTVVIPARLGSTRLPRKMLADLGGRPVLWHTWTQVKKMVRADEILILTDADEIYDAAKSWGASVLMTSAMCSCGTERAFSVLNELQGDFILLVQGDEPFIDPQLPDLIVTEGERVSCDIITPIFPLKKLEEIQNPNIVKVVRQKSGEALYFSRSAIPYIRGTDPEKWVESHTFFGHLGIYGYQRSFLEKYGTILSSSLEKAESLEQLRFLEAGYTIQTILVNHRSIAIDTPQDLQNARELL
ncbi:MAG: 3-deoxy-D-manno-octulosonate cytidylyltransferase [Verrucomicrobia bacterium GWC2_42_7]|nr:MAG: 3-deoxy-D-manno-octulosonate cytidylyltransferase [Verrucomicrobia bacterium GWC2_42_7]